MNPEPTNVSDPLPRVWQVDPDGWCCCSGLTDRQAEDLLDWLEANGFVGREVCYGEGHGFTVRWQP